LVLYLQVGDGRVLQSSFNSLYMIIISFDEVDSESSDKLRINMQLQYPPQ